MTISREKKPKDHRRELEAAMLGDTRVWLYVLIVVLWTLIGFVVGRMIYPRCPAACVDVTGR